MGVGAKVSLGVGRLLEWGRRGVWVESQAQSRAVYLFLFGPEAELTAWLLPSRAALDAAAAELPRKPLLVIITDQLAIAHKAEALGHFAIYFNLAPLRERMATLWLKNFLRVQFAQVPPEAVYFSPYFFPRIPRPRHVGQALAAMLRKFARNPLPHLLINELETDYKMALIGFYELWKAGNYAEPAGVYYFGDPAYLDVSSLFADKDYLKVEPLGWRVEPEKLVLHKSANARPLYLWLNNPLVAREVEQSLLKHPLSNERTIVTINSRTSTISSALDAIQGNPGMVIADTYAPLLPLLSAGAHVALLRNPSQTSQMGLVKYSFFAGQKRWPILARSEDVGELLRSSIVNPEIQKTPLTQIENAASADCHTQFIQKIYLPASRAH